MLQEVHLRVQSFNFETISRTKWQSHDKGSHQSPHCRSVFSVNKKKSTSASPAKSEDSRNRSDLHVANLPANFQSCADS